MSNSAELLTHGLTQGYAGKTKIEKTDRGGTPFKQSHLQSPEGGVYHDEWLPARTGGGQEIADTGQEKITRLYAGGVIPPEELQKLGITEKDVIAYLLNKVSELKEQTRLFSSCHPSPDGKWQYAYQVTDQIPVINLTRALETIHYQGVLVFAHGFEICPVVE